MKNKTNSNFNSLKDKILRPKSVYKKEVGPIKILSKTTKNKDKPIQKINDENKDINTIKSYKNNGGPFINNYNTLETKEEMTLENNQTISNFPVLTPNNRTINNQRAKTAKDRYRIKLENLENMFQVKPNFYYEKNKSNKPIK